MSHKLLSLNCIFFYTKRGDYVEVRVGKRKEVTQACYLAILDADRASIIRSEDVDDDNDDDAESLAL